jgi:arsenate reductase (thioredoxin)
MNTQLVHFIEKNIIETFHAIPEKRKEILIKLTVFIKKKLEENKTAEIIFVCTHNSRRSHMSQLWAQAAALYYKIPHVNCFSGGTEETAFNHRSVKALQKAGFEITQITQGDNPLYQVLIDDKSQPVMGFSKKFNHESNPQKDFCAVMTCTDADEACPFVPGAEARISLPYLDPKKSDDTAMESETYDARSIEIAREMFFAFSQVK